MISADQARADDPPPSCQGGESFQLALQLSTNGGASWLSSSSPWVFGHPGQTVEILFRTVLTTASGATQAWSFGVTHDPSSLQGSWGDLVLTDVTTAGTGTETVQAGGLPDIDETDVRAGFDGFTQGILIDTNQAITLGPVSGFVTSMACYRLTMPFWQGIYTVPVAFSHSLGLPAVRTVITQDGESAVPCARNVSLKVYVDPIIGPSPGGCWQGAAAMGGSGKPAESAAAGGGEGGAGPEGNAPFLRGDPNNDGGIDLTDVVFGLVYLFQQGVPPGCLDALDANDDEQLDISDPVYLLSFLFIGGAPPPLPFPLCGDDPTGEGGLGCGVATTSCCESATLDSDGDGLSNDCEALLGTLPNNPDTDRDSFTDGEEVLPTGVDGLNLAQLGADPLVPDVFVEIDWFELDHPTQAHDHRPLAMSLQAVVDAFRNAPFPSGCVGAACSGVTLHIDAGPGLLFNLDAMPSEDVGGQLIVTADVQEENYLAANRPAALAQAKAFRADPAFFDGAQRAKVFHYSLWCHDLALNAISQTGLAPNPWDDVNEEHGRRNDTSIVSLNTAIWRNRDVTGDQVVDTFDRRLIEGGTFMHELGHNFGLMHGGNFSPEDQADLRHRCKPNYLSVMNYRYQVRGLDGNRDHCPDRVVAFDYSRATLPTLNENNLLEAKGIDGDPGSGSTDIDWDASGSIDSIAKQVDINHDDDLNSGSAIAGIYCPQTDQVNFCEPDGLRHSGLTGFDDWAAIFDSDLAHFGFGGPRAVASDGGAASDFDPIGCGTP